MIVAKEPVASAAVVQVIVALAAVFGLHWSAAVVGPVVAALTVLLAALVRSKVTPVTPAGAHAKP